MSVICTTFSVRAHSYKESPCKSKYRKFARASLLIYPNYIHKCTKLKICKIQYFIATLHKNSIYATRRFKHLHLEIERIT